MVLLAGCPPTEAPVPVVPSPTPVIVPTPTGTAEPTEFPPACPDALEPNDTVTDAAVLTPGTYDGLEIGEGDTDVFEVAVEAGRQLRLRTTVNDLVQVDDDGEPVYPERPGLIHDVETAGVFRFRTVGRPGQACEPYTLTVQQVWAECPESLADPYESDGLWDTAPQLPESASGLTVGPERDRFVVDVPAAHVLNVQIASDDAEDMRLTIYESTSIPPTGSTFDEEPPLDLSLLATEDSTFAVSVFASYCVTYDLTAEVVPYAGCAPDALEPNDTSSTSRLLTQTTTGLSIDLTERDYFHVDVAPLERVVVRKRGPGGWLESVDSTGAPTGGPIGGFTHTNSTGVPSTKDFVVMSDSGCESYGLEVGHYTCDTEDVHEPNDTLAEAIALTSGTDLYVAETSPDHFYLGTVPALSTLQVELTFVDVAGNVDAELLNVADGSVLPAMGGQSNDDDEVVTWTNSTGAAVDVVVRVTAGFAALPSCYDNVRYDLSSTITP
jgi:hypothetical protein